MSSARPRALAALLGLLAIVLGSVGIDRHTAVETHARCEHGGFVHVERVSDAPPVQTADGHPTLAEPIWWETEGDHHCCSAVPFAAAAPEIHIQPAPALTAAEPHSAIISRVAITAALFRLAPKTSPPIAAV